MALGEIISTSLVAQTIQENSSDFGALCVAAKTNGTIIPSTTEVTAYDILELGGSGTGYLLNGAIPKHNYFSRGPSHWEYYVKQANPLIMGLKNRLNNAGYINGKSYSFSIGDYIGYNHDAVQPCAYQSGVESYYNDLLPTQVPVKIYIDFGDVDWGKVTSLSHTNSWLTDPYVGIYSIKNASGSEFLIESYSEAGSIALGTSGEIVGSIDNQNNTITTSTSFQVKLKIGQTDALINAFAIDDWFNCTVLVGVKYRPSFDSGVIKFFYDGDLEDPTMFITQNFSATLANVAGGSWTGAPPYSNAFISGSIQANTNYTSLSISWYISNTAVQDAAELSSAISNGDATLITSNVLYNSALYTTISLNKTGLTLKDDVTHYLIGYITAYTV